MSTKSLKSLSGFHQYYIDLIKTKDIITELKNQSDEVISFLKGMPEKKGDYAYQEGKWSIKEVVGHLADSERVFAYRAMSFARNDKNVLPGFEQDDWVKAANFNNRTLAGLIEELRFVRAANIAMFKSFNPEVIERDGIANNNSYTVKSLLYIIAGHEKHHYNILLEKY